MHRASTPSSATAAARSRESKCNASSAVSPPKEWPATAMAATFKWPANGLVRLVLEPFQLVQHEADVAEPSCLELTGLKLIERRDARQVLPKRDRAIRPSPRSTALAS
jgi:hypothetical protein